MTTRFWGPFLALAFVAIGAHAQTGLFGPVTSTPRAGDLAPELSFDKVLSAPENKTWIPASLFGQITVLAFLPNISRNPQSVAAANALFDQFARQSVQFVWITEEKDPSLVDWLAQHPLKGFVLLDSTGVTGRSYGLELPAAVFIGADGRIIGFDRPIIPATDTLKAVLEGRITTTPLKPGAAEFTASVESNKVRLGAQGPRVGRPTENKPDFPPSYTVHISPSEREYGTVSSGGPSWQSFQGFDLKGIISELYDINPIRIEIPASLEDGKLYDFSLVLPEAESHEKIYERLQQAIQDYFYLTATRQSRLMNVYVVTAPSDRKPPMLKWPEEFGGTIWSIRTESANPGIPKTFSLSAVVDISGEGTVDDFCKSLERGLDRPLLNETNLQGLFEFRVNRGPASNDFLVRLRDELGLAIEPAERNVQLLVFNRR
jgi:uncharacterized protein (TIGR03435 family)